MRKNLLPETIIPPELYVSRNADKQLKDLIESMGRPGYILVSRQMGKTNLLINAKRNLQSNEDIIIYIDLSNKFESARDCFRNIIDTIIETNYDLLQDVETEILGRRNRVTISEHKEHGYELRKLLSVIKGKLVISLDEIDSLTQADYSDKIFAQIRSIYFDRVNFSELNRLTYILSGVAEPSDIIKDSSISPFNIGQKIFLGDFSYEEFNSFITKSGMVLDRAVIDRIFYWTNGNPRLTWEICSCVEDMLFNGIELSESNIDEIVNIQYLTNYDKPPIDHIRTLVSKDSKLRDSVISLKYGKSNALSDDIKSKLYLAGILDSNYEEGEIKIKNRVIDLALDDKWLESLERSDSFSMGSADSSFSNKEYLKAIKQYEGLLQEREKISFIEEQLLYYKLAACYHYENDNYKVIEYCERYSIPISENKLVHSELLWFKGSAYQSLKQHSEAIECYKKLIVLDSDNKSALYYRSSIDYMTILLKDFSGLDYEKNAIENVICNLIEELSSEFGNEDSKIKKIEISDLLSLVYFTFGTFKAENKEFESAVANFKSSLDNAIEDTKFLPLYELIKLSFTYDKDSSNKTIYLDTAIAMINSSKRTVPFESTDFSLNGKLVGDLISISCRLYEREKLVKIIDSFKENVIVEDDNFYSLVTYSALEFFKANDFVRSLTLLEYVFSKDRKEVDPQEYYFVSKWITYLNEGNEQAKSVYFEKFLNYTSVPDNMDFSIFKSEIVSLRERNDYKKSVALCDVFLGSEIGEKNDYSNRMIPIVFLKMLCLDCNDARLSMAHHLKSRLELIAITDYEKFRLNASTIQHFVLNSNRIIAEFEQVKQVQYKQKRYSRNDKVKVKFNNGKTEIKKYKQVEDLIKSGACEII
ncbi:hypothetical protein A1OW_01395 [Enterovibrio norvegicus]|uniref:AAA-like domain-containing protein n=1 Tax=Enterovibrio norvegicus TaxID=188144 RepID=UPI0003029ED2|nr:AAA-like domain-containing protein [Enterovibrio norvegicus]OEF49753.1 hypothetical protein A1OW_01395 [Enterovibrio norvegicus]